jgi:hypothetical protein
MGAVQTKVDRFLANLEMTWESCVQNLPLPVYTVIFFLVRSYLNFFIVLKIKINILWIFEKKTGSKNEFSDST